MCGAENQYRFSAYGGKKKNMAEKRKNEVTRNHLAENEKTVTSLSSLLFLGMGESGFEPLKAVPADLQSVPFGHSGTPPGAGDRSRTNNLLITNQLLCH